MFTPGNDPRLRHLTCPLPLSTRALGPCPGRLLAADPRDGTAVSRRSTPAASRRPVGHSVATNEEPATSQLRYLVAGDIHAKAVSS